MNNEQLNALKESAYKTAVAHGFHEDVKPNVYYLGLVMSEMGEAINADRKGLHFNTKAYVEPYHLASAEEIKDATKAYGDMFYNFLTAGKRLLK